MAFLFYNVLFTFFIAFAAFPLPLQATINGFSVDLIHRTSPQSPLYSAKETPLQRFNNGFQRAVARISRLHGTSYVSKAPCLDVFPDNGEYVMKLSMGNPPVDIYGIVDTGSDLVWTQCQPCQQCYKQKRPIYNPKSSSTYSDIDCQSNECHQVDASCVNQSCTYSYGYGDNSITQGVIAKETITFNGGGQNPISFNNFIFGCGHNNSGTFNENEMGIVGLGGRSFSLSSQIGSMLGSNKFSYCLVPFHTNPNISSKMYFGVTLEDQYAITTPLVPIDSNFYFVTIEGISVGDKFVPYESSGQVSKGNVLIDSGTPPTLLPKDFYNRLSEEVRNSIPMKPYQDPDLGTQLCYKSNSVIDAPILTIHFSGGAQVPLVATSIFIPPKDGVFCFAMAPTYDGGNVGILGNFAQTNLKIGFDLDKQIVSFKQSDCTKEE